MILFHFDFDDKITIHNALHRVDSGRDTYLRPQLIFRSAPSTLDADYYTPDTSVDIECKTR